MAAGALSTGSTPPAWQIVAPDGGGAGSTSASPTGLSAQAPLPGGASTNGASATNGAMPAAAGAPQWPAPAGAGASNDIWAVSSQDVLDKPGAAGIQSCTSCGLPLSASARFCRRCGTQQH
jgi:hypothetical protein